MAGGAQKDDDEMITAINVTPLVDVVLVLLIILMVTANFIASRSIPMDLPSAQTGDGTPPRTLAISIDSEGALYLDAEPVTEEALLGGIRRYNGEIAEADRRASIAADARVSHGQVVHIIDVLRNNGVNRFAINVRPQDLQ